MKTRRFFAVILTCLVLTSVLGVTAFATASKPYTSYSTTISNGLIKDTATATIMALNQTGLTVVVVTHNTIVAEQCTSAYSIIDGNLAKIR